MGVTVVLTPISPPNAPLVFALWGDSTYAPAGGGQGGWQIVDRPRQVAATQWADRSPMSLSLPLAIDSETTWGKEGLSVEFFCAYLDNLQDAAPATLQPPICQVSGPIPGIQKQWVVQNVQFGPAIRDATAGFRTQQQVDLMLYEYNSPLQNTVNNLSPAGQVLQSLTASGSGGLFSQYAVRSGDTLSGIASRLLGNFAYWQQIAQLNGIRDPNFIYPGQVLKIPNVIPGT